MEVMAAASARRRSASPVSLQRTLAVSGTAAAALRALASYPLGFLGPASRFWRSHVFLFARESRHRDGRRRRSQDRGLRATRLLGGGGAAESPPLQQGRLLVPGAGHAARPRREPYCTAGLFTDWSELGGGRLWAGSVTPYSPVRIAIEKLVAVRVLAPTTWRTCSPSASSTP